LHGEKRQSVTITHYSKRKHPWRVTATRLSPITYTADANDGRTRRHRWTHLSGPCLSKADGKEQI
jgi:hypothetical protein